MGNFFKTMDLYKGIILLSAILTPVVLYWAWTLQDRIEVGKAAIKKATKKDGELAQIGQFKKQYEQLRQRKRTSTGVTNFREFFDKQFVESRIPVGAFSISDEKTRRIEKQGLIEATVTLKGRGKTEPYDRARITRFLYNAESQSPIWKLQKIKLVNPEITARTKSLPPEIKDEWRIQELWFARLMPDPDGGRRRRRR